MSNNYRNPCSRCGKDRIVAKVYEENLGYTTVTTKEMVCPDKDCQQKVSLDNKRREDKYANLKLKSAQRLIARKVAMDAARVAAEK